MLGNKRLDAFSFAVAVRHAGQVGGVSDGQGTRLLALVEVTATDSTSVHIRHTVRFTDVVFLVTNAVDTVVEVVARFWRTGDSGGLRGRGRRRSCCWCLTTASDQHNVVNRDVTVDSIAFRSLNTDQRYLWNRDLNFSIYPLVSLI